MTKELVTIEFRHMDKPVSEDFSGHNSKTIAIGVFDSFDDTVLAGNNALEAME